MSIIKQDGLSLSLTNGKVYCDSRELAKQFDKRHAHILRSIEKEIDRFNQPKNGLIELSKEYFKKSEYVDAKGRSYPRYLLSFKGFQQIALQFSGDEAFLNRVKFIEFFEKLIKSVETEKIKAIENSKDSLTVTFREEGKVSRKKLTKTIDECITKYRFDVEKKLNDGRYTKHYTDLIYSILNIDITVSNVGTRDTISPRQLVRLEDMEDKVADMIKKCSDDGVHYKDAYKIIKEELLK